MISDSHYDTGANHFDWGRAWQEHLQRSGLRANLARRGICEEEFWRRYDEWQQILRRSGYPGEILERILQKMERHFTILDIGAGAGAFALPLAGIARLVTAIEPSRSQVSRLTENAKAMQVKNLTVIESPWEDVSLNEIGCHDIVLAAYCFQMEDIEGALRKMCLAARRYLVLVHTAGHELVQPMRDIIGMEPGPDYIYLYNVLHRLGYRADVTILTRTYRIPVAVQMEMFRHNPGLDEKQCHRLLDWLEENDGISFREGVPCLERHHRDAVIWIDYDQYGSRNEL